MLQLTGTELFSGISKPNFAQPCATLRPKEMGRAREDSSAEMGAFLLRSDWEGTCKVFRSHPFPVAQNTNWTPAWMHLLAGLSPGYSPIRAPRSFSQGLDLYPRGRSGRASGTICNCQILLQLIFSNFQKQKQTTKKPMTDSILSRCRLKTFWPPIIFFNFDFEWKISDIPRGLKRDGEDLIWL